MEQKSERLVDQWIGLSGFHGFQMEKHMNKKEYRRSMLA